MDFKFYHHKQYKLYNFSLVFKYKIKLFESWSIFLSSTFEEEVKSQVWRLG